MSKPCHLYVDFSFPIEYFNETISVMRTLNDLNVLKTGNCSLVEPLVSTGVVQRKDCPQGLFFFTHTPVEQLNYLKLDFVASVAPLEWLILHVGDDQRSLIK